MKRVKTLLALLLVAAMMPALALVATAESNEPTRQINVVYDDSSSMIITRSNKVDTWCQAKYAMEVFAALLSEKDSMNVYVMSDYEGNSEAAGPRITLNGKDGANANASKIHNMVTEAMNTPFASVRKAYKDLAASSAEEKWLIILTDGEFEDGRMSSGEIDSFLAGKADDVKVMFLGMGQYAAGITSKPDKNIFSVKAETNEQILQKITDISTRVFNSHKLEIKTSSKKFSFDVPMSELVVFAQGKEVKLNGIDNAKGKEIEGKTSTAGVKYSEKAATNYSDIIIADNLVGSIVTYSGDYEAGDYSVDVNGAETIEVYYKPNVSIAAYLKTTDGDEVTDMDKLEAGDYVIEFGFVKAGTSEKLEKSELLGNVTYSAKVTNNGTLLDKNYSSGDKISLEEGDIKIDVVANYLDYNTVSANLSYTVYKNKEVGFEVLDNPKFTVSSDGINGGPIRIKVTLDGKDVSDEQWAAFTVPTVKAGKKSMLGDYKVEKDSELGVLDVYPALDGKSPEGKEYGDESFEIKYSEKYGDEVWSGKSDRIKVKIDDGRSWFEKNKDKIILGIIGGAGFLFLLGYVPGVKKYLPKSLKKYPYVQITSNEPGIPARTTTGFTNKRHTFVPYVAEKATISYEAKGCPDLEVKAIKAHRMRVTNIKEFAGREYISLNGQTMDEDVKKFDTSAGLYIEAKKGDWTYECWLNREEE